MASRAGGRMTAESSTTSDAPTIAAAAGWAPHHARGPRMRRGTWRPLVAPPAIVAGSLVVLLSAVVFGVSFSTLRLFPPFGGRPQLGRGMERSSFAPLTDRFVGQVLGPGDASSIGGVPGSTPVRGRSLAGPILPRSGGDHPSTNDQFEDAENIPSIPYTARTKTGSAGRQPGEPVECAPTGGTVWYRYVSNKDVALIANTFGTSSVTAVGIFTGSRLDDLKLIHCDTDARGNSQAGLSARAREVYFFQVTGPAAGGDLTVNVEPLGTPSLVSRSTSGEQANDWSQSSSISADGRHVAFVSWATNIVPDLRQAPCPSAEGTYFHSGTTMTRSFHSSTSATACPLVFVRDQLTGTTRLVSRSSSGQQANDASVAPSISADGRYIAFHSLATNLVDSDTNGVNDVFVHDVLTRRTTRVSVSSSGAEARDDQTPFFYETGSKHASISSDGRYVAFESSANNLVPGDTNGFQGTSIAGMDVFIHDRAARETKRISMSSTGMSSRQGEWYSYSPDISGDGKYVAFASSQNVGGTSGIDVSDIFVQALDGGATSRVSVSSSGERGDYDSALPRLSDDGRFVLFTSQASNLVAGDTNATWDLYLRDLVARTTTRVSLSSAGVSTPDGSISSDGRYVAYTSDANELDPGDGETRGRNQLFLHDRLTQTTILISVSKAGEQANDGSSSPSISADGKIVAFASTASNLVAGDAYDRELCMPGGGCSKSDVFVFERP